MGSFILTAVGVEAIDQGNKLRSGGWGGGGWDGGEGVPSVAEQMKLPVHLAKPQSMQSLQHQSFPARWADTSTGGGRMLQVEKHL